MRGEDDVQSILELDSEQKDEELPRSGRPAKRLHRR